MPLIDDTRPRMASGVASCRIVERSTTDTPSHRPDSNSNAADSQKCCDSAKPMMHSPKPATASSSSAPRIASAADAAPATGRPAPRRRPAPRAGCRALPGPQCRMSLMKAGSSATAPPNSTENMSSASAPSRIWWPNTKRRPSPMLAKIGARSAGHGGSVTRSAMIAIAAATANAAATSVGRGLAAPRRPARRPSAGPEHQPGLEHHAADAGAARELLARQHAREQRVVDRREERRAPAGRARSPRRSVSVPTREHHARGDRRPASAR